MPNYLYVSLCREHFIDDLSRGCRESGEAKNTYANLLLRLEKLTSPCHVFMQVEHSTMKRMTPIDKTKTGPLDRLDL